MTARGGEVREGRKAKKRGKGRGGEREREGEGNGGSPRWVPRYSLFGVSVCIFIYLPRVEKKYVLLPQNPLQYPICRSKY